ncbi:hypothetical protein CYMTET_10766 [Cymbomonas tetramitiformis]|uniref:EF-hand domain-containing protein n=1 Tax=Cymbomonas tetramitiformis TaxID=36881 RepID=A0AAE0LDP2_9CHLO|nr:hypothetical protein CYMTET_10766 [Cymbomonas tetramitiformis]
MYDFRLCLQLFTRLDKDNNGFLTREEVQLLVRDWARSNNTFVTFDEVKKHTEEIMAGADIHSTGGITLDQFLGYVRHPDNVATFAKLMGWHGLFLRYAREYGQTISVNGLKALMREALHAHHGFAPNDVTVKQAVDEMIHEVDVDRDNEISLEEFVHYANKTNSFSKLFELNLAHQLQPRDSALTLVEGDELEFLEVLYKRVDKGGDGFLQYDELCHLCYELLVCSGVPREQVGRGVCEEYARQILIANNASTTGKVDFRGFKNFVFKCPEVFGKMLPLNVLFQKYAQNEGGKEYILPLGLVELLKQLCEDSNVAHDYQTLYRDFQHVMTQADKDSDNKISFEEFIQFALSHPNLLRPTLNQLKQGTHLPPALLLAQPNASTKPHAPPDRTSMLMGEECVPECTAASEAWKALHLAASVQGS